MLKDECILVNYMDEAVWSPKAELFEVIGHNNKYNCHKFVPGQPRGLLSPGRRWVSRSESRHRAFSVLLFDSENRLLSPPEGLKGLFNAQVAAEGQE